MSVELDLPDNLPVELVPPSFRGPDSQPNLSAGYKTRTWRERRGVDYDGHDWGDNDDVDDELPLRTPTKSVPLLPRQLGNA